MLIYEFQVITIITIQCYIVKDSFSKILVNKHIVDENLLLYFQNAHFTATITLLDKCSITYYFKKLFSVKQ